MRRPHMAIKQSWRLIYPSFNPRTLNPACYPRFSSGTYGVVDDGRPGFALRAPRSEAEDGNKGPKLEDTKVPIRQDASSASGISWGMGSQIPKRAPELSVEEVAERMGSTKGSAGTLMSLWEQLVGSGKTPTPEFYGNALAALAIHPDYLLRSKILFSMKDNWMNPTSDQKVHHTLGLLRDGQYELALDTLDDLHNSDDVVPKWVYEIFILVFGQLGYLPEAVTILQYRKSLPAPISDNYEYFLLDACSAAFHYKGVKQLWQEVVNSDGRVTPSDGMLLNVLNTAARHSDTGMALEALDLLAKRHVQLGLHHFEPAMEAYAGVGDVEGAFRILCIMERAGLAPGIETTRPLFVWLREHRGQIDAAIEGLKKLKRTYRVPVVALNLLIEVLCLSKGVLEAVVLYREREMVFATPPNPDTFRLFLQLNGPPSVIAEMATESIRHAAIVAFSASKLASIASIAAKEGSLDAAISYLLKIDEVHEPESAASDLGTGKEEVADAWVAHEQTVREIVLALLEAEDGRVWNLLAQMQRRNPTLAKELKTTSMIAWERMRREQEVEWPKAVGCP